jgi:hypothetical protein
LSNRNAARLAVRFVILGTAGATLAGYSGYSMLPSRALQAPPVTLAAALESQIPNRAVKADRLAALIPTNVAAAEGASYTLASADPTATYGRDEDAVTAQALPPVETPPTPAPHAAKTHPEKAEAKLAALPVPAEKHKRLLPAPPPAPVETFLDDKQIAGIKGRLRLTEDQREYWPAVESALREVARKQFRGQPKHGHAKASIDVNAPEVQQLLSAAMPLLMRLREDQKHEVRKLARVIGLEQVASQI